LICSLNHQIAIQQFNIRKKRNGIYSVESNIIILNMG
jgi:hypothetical protein